MDEVELPNGVRVDPDNVVAKAFAVQMVAEKDGVATAAFDMDPDGFTCQWMGDVLEGEERGIGTENVYVVNYKKNRRWTWSVDPANWSVEHVG